MRCARCGNDNPGTNRFCGMCGATLLQNATPTPAPISAQGASTGTSSSTHPSSLPPVAAPPNPAPPRPPAREPAPVISGPSFLGLNDPAPAAARRGNLSIDAKPAPSSRNLDYLLEDEEEGKGGAGKFILIVVVLALVAGLGYLGWKNQGFGWLTKSKPAVAQDSNVPDSSASAPPSATGTNSSPVSPPPAAATASQPTTDSTPPAAASSPNSAPGTTPPSDAAAAPDSSATNPAPVTHRPAVKDPNADAADTPPAAIAKPKPVPADTTPAPRPVSKPAKSDSVSEAQKYLYGKGVAQDCDRGLRILKPAAAQANPKAMIEMGALYSAGLCTPRDLPTAYHWFAMALHNDPENASLQSDLQKLWSEMTQPERQLAIKLSQ